MSAAHGPASAPLLSVVLAVRDDADGVRATVRRVLAQTVGDVQVVVVDDGSVDDTGSVALELAHEHPDRVVVLRLPSSSGVAVARRRGVETATGDWVWFVDSDDDFPLDAAAGLLAAAHEDLDVVVASATTTSVGGTSRTVPVPPAGGPALTGQEALRLLLRGEITGHLWNKLFRRSVLLAIDVTPARVQSDLATTAQALAASRQVAVLDRVVYHYVKRPGSIITSVRQRSDSLGLVGAAVDSAVRRAGLHGSAPRDVVYFRTRFLVLSGIKDALQADYPPERRKHLLGELRPQLGTRAIAELLRRRDVKRSVLALTARLSPRLHLAVLERADR